MRTCCVLASDAGFFHQAMASIGTLKQAQSRLPDCELDIGFVAINLQPEQLIWLTEQGIRTQTRLDDFPRFADAPDYAAALTCRPYIPRIFTGYDGYLWVDSDIRFLSHVGLKYYLDQLANPDLSITAVQETEAAYSVHIDPGCARAYHTTRMQRIARVYAPDVVRYCEYFTPFNAGLFAARANSPIWARYRRNLGKALQVPFDGMFEQDALNVAMQEVGGWCGAPSVMNWLCSLRMPLKAADGTWRHPDEPSRQVFVAHLTSSTQTVAGQQETLFDTYRTAGLTE